MLPLKPVHVYSTFSVHSGGNCHVKSGKSFPVSSSCLALERLSCHVMTVYAMVQMQLTKYYKGKHSMGDGATLQPASQLQVTPDMVFSCLAQMLHMALCMLACTYRCTGLFSHSLLPSIFWSTSSHSDYLRTLTRKIKARDYSWWVSDHSVLEEDVVCRSKPCHDNCSQD